MEQLNLDTNMINDLFEAIVKTGIEITEPLDMGKHGGKIGAEADHQLNIIHYLSNDDYGFNFGPASNVNYQLTRVGAIAELTSSIIDVCKNNKLQFVSLVVPNRAVERAEQIKKDNIFIRYIVDYRPISDSLIERWDVLIKKVIKNA